MKQLSSAKHVILPSSALRDDRYRYSYRLLKSCTAKIKDTATFTRLFTAIDAVTVIVAFIITAITLQTYSSCFFNGCSTLLLILMW